MPDNTSSAWDLIVAPWHLDEHIPGFPVPVGTVATIGPPLPDGDVPGRVRVVQRAVADAVAGTRAAIARLAGALGAELTW
jgi:arginase